MNSTPRRLWNSRKPSSSTKTSVFREMALTGREPVPHQEILEVTAVIHAGAKSLAEESRFVKLAEVMA